MRTSSGCGRMPDDGELYSWLSRYGLAPLYETLSQSGITVSQLPFLSLVDYSTLGITSAQEHRKLNELALALRAHEATDMEMDGGADPFYSDEDEKENHMMFSLADLPSACPPRRQTVTYPPAPRVVEVGAGVDVRPKRKLGHITPEPAPPTTVPFACSSATFGLAPGPRNGVAA
eukprot:RCo039049